MYSNIKSTFQRKALEEIAVFKPGIKRRCVACNRWYQPINRYHFLCRDGCRRFWYGGWFKPRD